MCARVSAKRKSKEAENENKKEAVKKNQSSIQVLKTLKVLMEGNFTMAQIVEKLNENEKEPIFNNSVVSKYINTCRHCGIDIPKIHNTYFVASLPFGLDLSPNEIDLLNDLQVVAGSKMSKSSIKDFRDMISKLSKYSNKRIVRLDEKTEQMTYRLFDTAIMEKRFVELMFRAKAVLKCIPLYISEKKGKPCFVVSYNNKERFIAVERLTGFEILDESFIAGPKSSQEAVFKLTGGLAKRYTLRENEHFLQKNDEETVVSSTVENKRELFERLLRYDKDCEILQPEHYRLEMKETIDNMLANYEE